MTRLDFKDSEDMAKILVKAEDEITPYLRSHDGKVIHDEYGDVELGVEREYAPKLGRFLEKRGIHPAIISEGEYIADFEGGKRNCVIFLDPFEGSTNMRSGRLPYGVNLLVFPDKEGDILAEDWGMAFVADRKNSIKYVAHRGRENDVMYIIDKGVKRPPNPNQDKGEIIEVPKGYTQMKREPIMKQTAYYIAIMDALYDDQYRSVDATGIQIANVVDGKTRAYVEGRGLRKLYGAWNILPSGIIVNTGGGIATHLDGTKFDKDVVWNPKRFPETGYNPDACGDVLAANNLPDYQACLHAIKAVIGREREYLRENGF